MASGTDSGLFSKFQERLRRMRIARGKRRRDEDIYINKKVEEIHKVVGKERVEKRDRYVNDSSDKDAINKLQSDDSLLNKKNKKISVSSDELDSFKKDGLFKENATSKDVLDDKSNLEGKISDIELDNNLKDKFNREKVFDNVDNDVYRKEGIHDKKGITSYVSYDDVRKKRTSCSNDVERIDRLRIIEGDLISRIRESFEDKLDELEILDGRLYLLSCEKEDALVIEQMKELKIKIDQFISELNHLINQYNAYKKNYYLDHVTEIDDDVIVDDMIDYRILLDNMDDEKKFVSGYKKLQEFEEYYNHLKKIKSGVGQLKKEVEEKSSQIYDRDDKYHQITSSLVDVNAINQSCNEEINRQNDYFDNLLKNINDIEKEEYTTNHLRGLGDLAAMSFKYLGLMMLNPLKGTIPGIGIQTLAARNMVVNMYHNLHFEEVKHIHYKAHDFENEINDKLNDINYTSILIDDTLKKIDMLSHDFMLQYDSNIPSYDDTLNKIQAIRHIVFRNQNKVNKIKSNLEKGKKINEEKLIRVRELNERH